jgi:alkylation response protein AidB-like acyl-CoA dehydrogenase
MDFELSPEQKEIQALTRDFVCAEVEPHAAEWDREHYFPREVFGRLAQLGLMGVCVPEEYGGAGADFLSYMLVLEELSRGDAGSSLRSHTASSSAPSR